MSPMTAGVILVDRRTTGTGHAEPDAAGSAALALDPATGSGAPSAPGAFSKMPCSEARNLIPLALGQPGEAGAATSEGRGPGGSAAGAPGEGAGRCGARAARR
jgi:hypothetical protein